jgi:hypothetical protein
MGGRKRRRRRRRRRKKKKGEDLKNGVVVLCWMKAKVSKP